MQETDSVSCICLSCADKNPRSKGGGRKKLGVEFSGCGRTGKCFANKKYFQKSKTLT
jgi:hypothetical protein